MTRTTVLFGSIFNYIILNISVFLFIAKVVSLIVIFSPIYVLRFIISKLRAFGPNIADIFSSRSCLFGIDPVNEKPLYSLLICAHLKGDSPDIVNYLRELVLSKVIHVRNENGRLRNEQMQQYKYKWMGFLFWKWDEKFDVSNHVNFYSSQEIEDESKISQAQLKKIENHLLLKPFMKNKSPWEILVVRNVESENGDAKSVIYFCVHHSLGDGLSLMKIVFGALVQDGKSSVETFMAKPNVVQESVLSKLWSLCINVLLGPYQFAKYCVESIDENAWTKFERNKNKRTITTVSEKISFCDLKEIANFHQVNLTAVTYAGLTAGVRKAMLRKYGKTPKHIHSTCAAYIPGHPNNIANHFSVVSCRLPVGTSESVERLKKQQKYLDRLKNSVVPGTCFYLMSAVGALFPEMVKHFAYTSTKTTVSGTCFPGPKHKVYIDSQEITDLYFYHGPGMGNTPIMFHFLTYSDSIRFTVTADESLVENEETVAEMIQDIINEFCVLKTGLYV